MAALRIDANGYPELSGPDDVLRQKYCILTMFLKLRMFSSHLLTAQDIVQYILCADNTLEELKLLAEEDSDDNSCQIAKSILSAKIDEAKRAQSSETTVSPEIQPLGDLTSLIRDFRELVANARDEEKVERFKCPSCTSDPLPTIVTSCRHLYCEECYNSLPGKDGSSSTQDYRICCNCDIEIHGAATWSSFDRIAEFVTLAHSPPAISRKRPQNSRPANAAAGKSDFPRWVKAFPRTERSNSWRRYGLFHSSFTTSGDYADRGSESEPEKLIRDWIPMIGSEIPAAKLTKSREILKAWIEEDATVKIVVFVFFLSSVELFGMMCKQEGWSNRKVRSHIYFAFLV